MKYKKSRDDKPIDGFELPSHKSIVSDSRIHIQPPKNLVLKPNEMVNRGRAAQLYYSHHYFRIDTNTSNMQ